MAEVIWTESALKDIEEIALFISNDSYFKANDNSIELYSSFSLKC